MSRREWESGTVKLSVKEFTRFRQELVTTYNQAVEHDLKLLALLHAALAAAAKGKRKFDYRNAINEECAKTVKEGLYSTRSLYPFKLLDTWSVAALLLGENGKLRAPKKKDLPTVTVGAKADSFPPPQGQSKCRDGHIALDAQAKTVTWTVSEGNHACDDAQESLYGKFFYHFMAHADWTRDTGGTIVGNDEYNEDNKEAGGGANYIKTAWGPRGTAEQEASWGIRVPRTSRRIR